MLSCLFWYMLKVFFRKFSKSWIKKNRMGSYLESFGSGLIVLVGGGNFLKGEDLRNNSIGEFFVFENWLFEG